MTLKTTLLVLFLAACLAPGASAYNVYVADLHAHSAYSDGIGTPAEAFSYARDVANIDVLALTDHSGYMNATTFNSLLLIANSFTQDGVFVGLGAQEFGNLNDFNHIAIYDVIYRCTVPTTNLLATYQFITGQGGIGQFNHPNPSYGTNFDNLAYYSNYVDEMTSIEIRNGQRTDNYEVQYIQALNNGWRVGPSANQDNHEGHWGDQMNPSAGNRIYLTGILANALTRADILDALRQRRFFAEEIGPPDDRMSLEFYVNGSIMGQEITTGPHLTLTGSAQALNGTGLFNYVDIFEDGIIIESLIALGTSITWSFDHGVAPGSHHYYFARVHQVDGDYAWSSPIWVTITADPAGVEGEPAAPSLDLLTSAPNPFGRETRLSFHVPQGLRQPADLAIRDLSGRLVARMGETMLGEGCHEWTWRALDTAGNPLPAGVYFAELRLNGTSRAVRRLVLSR